MQFNRITDDQLSTLKPEQSLLPAKTKARINLVLKNKDYSVKNARLTTAGNVAKLPMFRAYRPKDRDMNTFLRKYPRFFIIIIIIIRTWFMRTSLQRFD